jgi:hypothetical protein
MAKKNEVVISHWYKLFEGFQESPKQIYQLIEEAISKRELLEISTTRVNYFEGGPLSAQREYLRVSRRDLFFDICAAHFGKGMFMSWWLSEDKSSKGIWILIGILILAYYLFRILVGQYGLFLGIIIETIVAFFLFLIVGNLTHKGEIKIEDSILGIPILGFLYDHIFHPVTFYKVDTALMFQESVRSAVNEVLDTMTAQKGIRALSEEEKKPIMSDLIHK